MHLFLTLRKNTSLLIETLYTLSALHGVVSHESCFVAAAIAAAAQ
jgi:hypothetical protein